MVKSVSNMNVANDFNIKIKKQNNNNLSKANLTLVKDSISFKGNPTTKVVSEVSKKASGKTIKGLFLALAGLIGLGSAKASSKSVDNDKDYTDATEKLLQDYRAKYPDLMEYLDNATYEAGGDGFFQYKTYTDAAKIVIVKAYEENPEKALYLSKILQKDNSNLYPEDLLDKMNSNYEELSNYINNGSCLLDAYKRLNLVEKNPNLYNIAQYDVVKNSELELYDKYCVDEESKALLEKVIELTKNNVFGRTTGEHYIQLANYCKKYPDIPGKVIENLNKCYIDEKTDKVLEEYSNKWDELLELMSKVHTMDIIKAFPFLENADIVNFASTYVSNDTELSDFVVKITKTEKLFKEILTVNPDFASAKKLNEYIYEGEKLRAQKKYLHREDDPLLDFINGLNEDNIKLYERMVKDKRCHSLTSMQNLLKLYEKYPDKEITDEMVERYNDPAARAMKLY